ncbi:MAG: hypothetical protein NTV63_00715 [Candidatus Woesearchaeota archaeon]|nr:hypothetical protein [Candidatus Woesearchaeota archaeon]
MEKKSAKKPNLNHTNKFTNHISYKTMQSHHCLGEFIPEEKKLPVE